MVCVGYVLLINYYLIIDNYLFMYDRSCLLLCCCCCDCDCCYILVFSNKYVNNLILGCVGYEILLMDVLYLCLHWCLSLFINFANMSIYYGANGTTIYINLCAYTDTAYVYVYDDTLTPYPYPVFVFVYVYNILLILYCLYLLLLFR